jgi:hypothetical protein
MGLADRLDEERLEGDLPVREISRSGTKRPRKVGGKTMQKSLMALAIAAFSMLGAMQAVAQSSPALKSEELDQLIAPIALYPDTLLSQVLIASTYPLEVVEAERWAEQNKNLKGDALKKAVDQKKWDDSIKSLAATPDVLSMMSDKLDWTQKLGDAVLAQQADVMDAIQRLRQKAQANDKLKTTKQQKVTTTTQDNRQYIAIEPAEPNTVYVPYYDPAVVYGAWPYPAYPPYYFGAPGYIAGGLLATGLAFGAGYAVGAWAQGGSWWGGNVNWGNNNININNDIDINKRNNWVHNSDHRHGVRYSNNEVRQKFSKTDIGNRDNRLDFRGHDGKQVLKPASDRPGDRPGGRPETRPGDRPGGKDARPGGDKRPGGDRPGKDARPGGDRQKPAARPQGPQRGGGFDNVNRGGGARDHARGQASLGPRGGGGPRVGAGGGGGPRVGGGGGGGGRHVGGGGGGPRGGGGGGRGGGGRGGGRR